MISRRNTLGAALTVGGLPLTGCGAGGDATDIAALDRPDPSLAPAPPPGVVGLVPSSPTGTGGSVIPNPTGRYRSDQRYLFQNVANGDIAARLPGGAAFNMERWGPTADFVDFRTKWPWTRKGGDWIDANGVRHGTKPWASIAATFARGLNTVATYRLNVTTVLKRVQTEKRWCALVLTSAPALRPIASNQQSVHPRPVIEIKYTDGTSAQLPCRIVASITSGSRAPQTTNAQAALPAMLEFEPPAKPVSQATLRVVVVSHPTNVNNPMLNVYLVDPPLNDQAARRGLADTARALDEGLASHSAVIGVHQYVDGAPLSRFVDGEGKVNTSAEVWFDPAIWGSGSQDTDKLPHRSLGKWVGTGANWSKVESGYAQEGFKPLANGLGALRIVMPRQQPLSDGDVVGYGGTLAANAFIFLPDRLFGRLGRIFVRHYFRLGTPDGGPYAVRQAQRHQVRNTPDRMSWVDHAGKFGLMPEHVTSYGGVSGSSGGGRGWQLRMAWSDCDAEQGGPDEGGVAGGMHLWDFQQNNPPGHNYANRTSGFGQIGGLGGMLYAHKWYCLESEVKLNSVDKPAVLPDGTPHVVNGVRQYWTPDGAIRHWVDGRLVYEDTGMVFRSLPLHPITGKFDPRMSIRPCRELGVRGLWLNWFHGGVTPNAIDRVVFITGVAWAQEYIGPMRM